MSVQTLNYGAIIEQLPSDSTLILRHIGWEEYEALLESVGEASGLRISFDQGTLQIMTLSAEHENYKDLIQNLVRFCTLRLGIKLRSFGSATIKQQRKQKGSEPDGCFYIQSAALIGNRKQIDFASDPPPDIVVEVDIHHDSRSKFPIYAAFGVPELWRYDGSALSIYHLQAEQYVPAPASLTLPVLTGEVLTDFLARTQREDENTVLLAFEEWLRGRQP